MPNTVSGGMKRYANWKFILPLLFLLIIILVLMDRGPFGSGKLRELSGGTGMLEMQFGYSEVRAYAILEKLGSVGRQLYVKLLGLDFLFILVYAGFQSLLITALMKKANWNARLAKLNLLPLLGSALDIAENCLLLFLILSFPIQHASVVRISSAVTAVKLAIYYGCMAVILILGYKSIQQTQGRKNLKEKERVL